MLNALSPDGKSGYKLYSDYFDKFCLLDDEINVSCLKRSGKCEKLVKRHLFKKKFPLKEPAFFNFFSHHDVNRVASHLNLEIVVYAVSKLNAEDSVIVLHDFRSLQSSSSSSQRQTRYFVYLTHSARLRSLLQPLPVNSKKIFFSEAAATFKTGEIVEAVDRLLHSRDFVAPGPKIQCPLVSDLQQKAGILYKRWTRNVIIVSFCRLLKRGSWGSKKRLSDCYFVTLALVTSSSSSETGRGNDTLEDLGLFDDQNKPVIIAIYNGNIACKMNSEFSKELLCRYRDARDRKEKLSGRNFMENPKISTSERLAARKVWREAADRRRKKNQKTAGNKNSAGRICKCPTCSSDAFDENMAASGPEQLCTASYSVSELLKMLGAWNPSVEKDLDRLCELSIASMDIESKTVEADVGSPSHGQPVEYRQIDTSKIEGYVKKIQKPIMIAHCDSFLSAVNTGTKIFTAHSDSESAIFEMMKSYWDYVLERQRAAQTEKLRIASPLYSIVNKYRRAFFELASDWFSSTSSELREKQNSLRRAANSAAAAETSDASYYNYEADLVQDLSDKLEFTVEKLNAAWRQTVPGKLEAGLDRLVEQYEVFSFYG